MAIYNVTTYQKTEINRDLTCSITSRSDWCFDLVKERSNLGFIHKKTMTKVEEHGLVVFGCRFGSQSGGQMHI